MLLYYKHLHVAGSLREAETFCCPCENRAIVLLQAGARSEEGNWQTGLAVQCCDATPASFEKKSSSHFGQKQG